MEGIAETFVFQEWVEARLEIAHGISGYMLWPGFRQWNQALNKDRF